MFIYSNKKFILQYNKTKNKSEFILNNNNNNNSTLPIPNSNVFIKLSKSKSHVNNGKDLSLKTKYVKKPNTSIINNKELAANLNLKITTIQYQTTQTI